MLSIPSVLFVCTGNVYRSRFAEALFNHHAEEGALGWCAFSRGLAPHLAEEPHLAPETRDALEARGIDLHHTAATKTPLAEADLRLAHLIIGLSEQEHAPMVRRQFPDWSEQFNFWQVEDIALWDPERALGAIETEVRTLIGLLKDSAS